MSWILTIIIAVVVYFAYTMLFSPTTKSITKLQEIANKDPKKFFSTVLRKDNWTADKYGQISDKCWKIVLKDWDGCIYITYMGNGEPEKALVQLTKEIEL